MVRYVTYVRYEPYAIGVITGYEFAALLAHRSWLPTITTLISRLPKFARRAIACAAGVWLYLHFGEER
jgi:hypothetical protein